MRALFPTPLTNAPLLMVVQSTVTGSDGDAISFTIKYADQHPDGEPQRQADAAPFTVSYADSCSQPRSNDIAGSNFLPNIDANALTESEAVFGAHTSSHHRPNGFAIANTDRGTVAGTKHRPQRSAITSSNRVANARTFARAVVCANVGANGPAVC